MLGDFSILATAIYPFTKVAYQSNLNKDYYTHCLLAREPVPYSLIHARLSQEEMEYLGWKTFWRHCYAFSCFGITSLVIFCINMSFRRALRRVTNRNVGKGRRLVRQRALPVSHKGNNRMFSLFRRLSFVAYALAYANANVRLDEDLFNKDIWYPFYVYKAEGISKNESIFRLSMERGITEKIENALREERTASESFF